MAPAAAASSFSGFGDRLRSVCAAGATKARQRDVRGRDGPLLEDGRARRVGEPPPSARRASSIRRRRGAAFFACVRTHRRCRAEPMEPPPGAEKKRKRRLEGERAQRRWTSRSKSSDARFCRCSGHGRGRDHGRATTSWRAAPWSRTRPAARPLL